MKTLPRYFLVFKINPLEMTTAKFIRIMNTPKAGNIILSSPIVTEFGDLILGG